MRMDRDGESCRRFALAVLPARRPGVAPTPSSATARVFAPVAHRLREDHLTQDGAQPRLRRRSWCRRRRAGLGKPVGIPIRLASPASVDSTSGQVLSSVWLVLTGLTDLSQQLKVVTPEVGREHCGKVPGQ